MAGYDELARAREATLAREQRAANAARQKKLDYDPLTGKTKATPQPPSAWAQEAAARRTAGEAERGIAERFQKFNSSVKDAGSSTPAASPTRTPIATRAQELNSKAGRFLPYLEVARGAVTTGAELKDRTAQGEGFLNALGNTLSGNVKKSAVLMAGGSPETLRAEIDAYRANKAAPNTDIANDAQQRYEESRAADNKFTQQPTLGAAVGTLFGSTKEQTAQPAAPTPAAPAPQPTEQLTPYEMQVKALQAAGAKPNDPAGVAVTPGTTAYIQDIPDPTGNDNRTRATVPGKGFAEIQRGSGIDDASVFRGARGGNLFSGARTDAEAARALQARAEQDQAASVVAQQSNRAAEALRDTRAAKMGISREQLDASEGYARPDMPMNPAERIQQATKRFAESQMTDGDKAMMSGQIEIAKAQIEEQRAQEAARGNLEATRLAQIGGARREELQQQGLDRRESADAANKDYSAGATYYTKVTSPDGKNPPMISPAEWGEALASLDNNETAQALQIPPETIQRWKSGKMRESETQWLAQNIMEWKRSQRGTIMGFFRGQPSLQDVMVPQ